MKKILIWVAIILVCLVSSPAMATSGVCTERSLEVYESSAILTFDCTAGSTDHLYPSTNVSATSAQYLRGYYIAEVYTIPGSTGPTTGTTVVLNTADSPAKDMLGGVVTCHNTAANRFVPKVDTTNVLYGGSTFFGIPALVISGNSVNSAVMTVRFILWKN